MERSSYLRRDRDMIKAYCILNHVPDARGAARGERLTYVKGKGQGSFPDDDNLRKSLLDALVASGVLQDDSPSWVEMPPVCYQKGDQPMTIIDLEDLGP